MRDVAAYLAQQASKSAANAELAQAWADLEDLYNRKLWHQLTLKLLEFVKHESNTKGTAMVQMYEQFISDFEHRINQLSFVELMLHVVRQMPNPKDALEFMKKIQEKVGDNKEARILAMTAIGNIHLQQRDMPTTLGVLEAAEKELDQLDSVTSIHGRFYELSSNYHKLMGAHCDYYRDALRFLGCVSLQDIPAPEQEQRAFNLSLAALLGKGVYNFGELLAHPILDALRASAKSWIVDVLYAFNTGNIAKFDALQAHWSKQPDLAAHERAMRQKITLLCLMEMTFKRQANDRQLSFEAVAAETRLPVDEVELLVMKALSLDLVRGSIDQVARTVHMTWVQPRVLDRDQIAGMATRLQSWSTEVKAMEMMVETRAGDILVQ